MAGERNLKKLLSGMSPKLNPGAYVFSTVINPDEISRTDTLCEFREEEGITIIIEKSKADKYKLPYNYIASWITLSVHSSLEAVGLTAAFSSELANHGISCNVVAGYYHDHIFVDQRDERKAMKVLENMSKNPD